MQKNHKHTQHAHTMQMFLKSKTVKKIASIYYVTHFDTCTDKCAYGCLCMCVYIYVCIFIAIVLFDTPWGYLSGPLVWKATLV